MIEPKEMLGSLVDNFVKNFIPSPKVLIIGVVLLAVLLFGFVYLRIKFGQIIQTRGKLDGL